MLQKKIAFLCLSFLCPMSVIAARPTRNITGSTILVSKLLKTIDGKSFGLHGQTIRAMLIIRGRILNILTGIQKNGHRIGLYIFNNAHHTVKQLHEIEQSGTVDKQTLSAWLHVVKQDFAIQIDPFLDLGRGFKPQMLILIEESLRLHRRQNSLLHMWAGEPEGDDMIGFDREVQSFDDLYLFLNDLQNFLDDLISSCPKACQQFLDSLTTAQERKVYAQRFIDVFERQKQKINTRA